MKYELSYLVKYIFLLSVFFTLATICGNAQFYSFRSFSVEQGLPQSEVNAVIDDHLGYLWVATNGGGLCRFDGRSFDIFNKKDGLPDNVILSVFQDNRTNIWIATNKGLVKYDGKQMVSVIKSDTTVFNSNVSFFQTTNGALWLAGNINLNQRVIYSLQGDSLISGASIFPDVLTDNEIFAVTGWGRKQIMLSTARGLFTIDNSTINAVDIDRKFRNNRMVIIPLIEDRFKNLWFKVVEPAGSYGLISVDTGGEVTRHELPDGMSVSRILSMYEDRDGGLWISVAFEGLVYKKNGVTTVFNQTNGLPTSLIQNVFQDREGNFWFGSTGEGLIKYSSNFFTSFTELSGLGDDLIIGIAEDSKGNKLFSDSRGGLTYFNGSKLEKVGGAGRLAGVLRGHVEFEDGRQLMGSARGLWSYKNGKFTEASAQFGLNQNMAIYDILLNGDTLFVATSIHGVIKVVGGKVSQTFNIKNSNLPSNFAKSLFLDSRHRLWIATDKGLAILTDGELFSYGEKEGMPSNNVFQFAEDGTGNIWIANFTGGLVRYDGDGFKVFNSDTGLSSDIIYSVIADKNGDIWAGSQLGVEHLILNQDGKVEKFFWYDKNDGFTGIENNAGSAMCDSDGILWFGTIKGVIRCIPDEKSFNQLPATVFVDKIVINNDITNWASAPFNAYCDSVLSWHQVPAGLKLPSHYNHISFSFDALCYTQPEKVLYRWKLSPIDQDFTPATTNNVASYTMLPPGDYSLQVIACNNDGVWSVDGDTFNFSVKAPWWKTFTPTFLLSLLGIIIAIVVIILRNRMLQRHRMELDHVAGSHVAANERLKTRMSLLQDDVISLKLSVDAMKHNKDVYYNQIAILKELLSSVNDKLSETTVVGFIHRMISQGNSTDFFGYCCYDPVSESAMYKYSVQNGERMSVFSTQLNDVNDLVVIALRDNRGFLYSSADTNLATHKVAIANFEAQSAVIMPFTLVDGTRGVLVAASENALNYDDIHYSLLEIAASVLSCSKN